jgi:hypothetical protein
MMEKKHSDVGDIRTLRTRVIVPIEELFSDPIDSIMVACADQFDKSKFLLLVNYQQKETMKRCWLFSEHVYEIMKDRIPANYEIDSCSLGQATAEAFDKISMSLTNGS